MKGCVCKFWKYFSLDKTRAKTYTRERESHLLHLERERESHLLNPPPGSTDPERFAFEDQLAALRH